MPWSPATEWKWDAWTSKIELTPIKVLRRVTVSYCCALNLVNGDRTRWYTAVSQSLSPSITQAVTHSVHKSVIQSVSEFISQSLIHSINYSVTHTVNKSVSDALLVCLMVLVSSHSVPYIESPDISYYIYQRIPLRRLLYICPSLQMLRLYLLRKLNIGRRWSWSRISRRCWSAMWTSTGSITSAKLYRNLWDISMLAKMPMDWIDIPKASSNGRELNALTSLAMNGMAD